MAGSDVEMAHKELSLVDLERLRCKKFKVAELPVSASQRAAVDSLLYLFKKKGGFDLARKQIWGEFNRNDAKRNFAASLNQMAESEIERDSSLLSRERGKAATLVEGAVDRSDIYKSVEAAIDDVASSHLDSILSSLRSIRHEEAGGEVSLAEEMAGNVTDEDYERLIRGKREQREQTRQTELVVQQQKEAEEAKVKAEELQRQREIRKSKDEEDRRKHKEREERRRAEREKLRQGRLRLDEPRELQRKERYERKTREGGERYRASIRTLEEQDSCEYDRNRSWRGERDRDSRRGRSPGTGQADQAGTKPVSRKESRTQTRRKSSPCQLNEKSLEATALELLLKEGKELAEKSRQKPEFDFEQAEALENSQNQQSQPVAGPDSKVSYSDPTHARQAPNTQKEQDDSCIPGKIKRRSSQVDPGCGRDHGRMDTNISKTEYSSRCSESIGLECKEREPGCREGSDFGVDRYRRPLRDRRDTEDRVNTRSRGPRGSRSRSMPRARGEGTGEYRGRRSDPDRITDKGVAQAADRSQGNQYREHDRIKSGDGIRMAAQVMENGDRESEKGRAKDKDRDGDRAIDRGRYRERAYDRDYDKTWDEERSYRPRRASRSRSRSARRRGRRQSRSEARCRTRSRSRSRSPTRRRVKDGHRSDSRAGVCSETPNVLDIDRYVPSTSNRSRSPKRRERDRERSRDRDEKPRHYDIDRYIPSGKEEDLRPSGVNRDELRRGRSRSR